MPRKSSDKKVSKNTERKPKRQQARMSKLKTLINEANQVTGSEAMDYANTEKGKGFVAPPIPERELKIRRISLVKTETVSGVPAVGIELVPEIANNSAAESKGVSSNFLIRSAESTSNGGVNTGRGEDCSTPLLSTQKLKIRNIQLLERKIRIKEAAAEAALAPENSRTSVTETEAASCKVHPSISEPVLKKAVVTEKGEKLWTPCIRSLGESRLKIRRICLGNEITYAGGTAEHPSSKQESNESRASTARTEFNASISVKSTTESDLPLGMSVVTSLDPTPCEDRKNDEASGILKFENQLVRQETGKLYKQKKKSNHRKKNKRQTDKLKQKIYHLERTLQQVQNIAPQNFGSGPLSIRTPYNISLAMQSASTRQLTAMPSPFSWISPPMPTSTHFSPENSQGRSFVPMFPPTRNFWIPSQQSTGIQGALWQPTPTQQNLDIIALDQLPYIFY